jgi:cytochrome c oxidase subunit 4
MAYPSTPAGTQADGPPQHAAHIVPVRVLAATLALLLLLTFITVGVTWSARLDFGVTVNLWIALTIATLKATLVVLYFMHVRYEKPIVGIFLIVALAFVLLFAGATLMDTTQYQPDIQQYRDDDPNAHYAPALQQP